MINSVLVNFIYILLSLDYQIFMVNQGTNTDNQLFITLLANI